MRDYSSNDNDIDNVIIAGDFNQSIASNEIQKFLRNAGVQDAHKTFNVIPLS